MKFVNIKYLAAAFLGLVCLAQSVSADTLADIRQRKKIVIAIDLGSPPFGMTDDKLQPYGSDVSAAKMLAKDLGVEMEIIQVTGPQPRAFSADQQGRHRDRVLQHHAGASQGDQLQRALQRV